MTLHLIPPNFLIHEENFIFFFISVGKDFIIVRIRSMEILVQYINTL
jgi:hypothetical protein